MSDDQLKQLLAKMLPEKVRWTGYILCDNGGSEDEMSYGRQILDAELLHLCSLVEAGLPEKQSQRYISSLAGCEPPFTAKCAFAKWQQRTTALAEAKGVTL